MNAPNYIRSIRQIIIGINLAVAALIGGVIWDATAYICMRMKAREFLSNVGNVPRAPESLLIFLAVLLVLLIATILLRKAFFRSNQTANLISCILEILICCAIVYFLNLSYKGILLLAMSSVILYIEENKTRVLLIAITLILFIFMDYSILNEFYRMGSFGEFIQYYRESTRFILAGTLNILTSLNEILFIIFIFFVLQQEIAQSHKLRGLYEKLYKNREELKLANLQLQEYAVRSEKMAETRERNRLAREIHDTLGHVLTGISTGIEACITLIDVNVPKTRTQLEHIRETARNGLVDVRRSVKALRPDALERFELQEALQKLAQDVSGVADTDVSLSYKDETTAHLGANEEETLYRIVQESVTNSVRHGNAKHVHVRLHKTAGRVTVEIHDDGMGCAKIEEGFGLRHISERVASLGGTVAISSNEGFHTIASIPFRIGEKTND